VPLKSCEDDDACDNDETCEDGIGKEVVLDPCSDDECGGGACVDGSCDAMSIEGSGWRGSVASAHTVSSDRGLCSPAGPMKSHFLANAEPGSSIEGGPHRDPVDAFDVPVIAFMRGCVQDKQFGIGTGAPHLP